MAIGIPACGEGILIGEIAEEAGADIIGICGGLSESDGGDGEEISGWSECEEGGEDECDGAGNPHIFRGVEEDGGSEEGIGEEDALGEKGVEIGCICEIGEDEWREDGEEDIGEIVFRFAEVYDEEDGCEQDEEMSDTLAADIPFGAIAEELELCGFGGGFGDIIDISSFKGTIEHSAVCQPDGCEENIG